MGSTGDPGADGTPRPRPLRPRRGLPGSRAVVGGLLVAAAAIGIFAAYTGATSGPDTSYVVVTGDVPVGATLAADDLALEVTELNDELRNGVFSSVEDLVGAVTLAPLNEGELVQVSSVLRSGGGDEPQPEVSFSIERNRAVAGTLRPNERVGVFATYGSGDSATTRLVVPEARVVTNESGGGDGALGSDGQITVTLALTSADEVLQLTNAIDAAIVTLVRTTGVARPEGGPTVYQAPSGDDRGSSAPDDTTDTPLGGG
ncbi:hypothetical protein BH20ACT2_BH20ACT2_24000 [soil metagenome]